METTREQLFQMRLDRIETLAGLIVRNLRAHALLPGLAGRQPDLPELIAAAAARLRDELAPLAGDDTQPGPAGPPLQTEDGRPGRLVITGDDLEVASRHYRTRAGADPSLIGLTAALESYARRVELGLAKGIPAEGASSLTAKRPGPEGPACPPKPSSDGER